MNELFRKNMCYDNFKFHYKKHDTEKIKYATEKIRYGKKR